VARVALEIPKVGLVMENARLVRWLKKVGETVTQGEPLLELETEKSVVEIEATDSGRLVEILLEAEQEARVGDRVGWLEVDAAGAAPARRPPSGGSASDGSASGGSAGSAVLDAAASAPPKVGATGPAAAHGSVARIRSSPVARRLATEYAIDLHQIAGTGPRGRVQLADVRRALEDRGSPTTADGQPPLSNMRRALARAMTLSNATVPQFNVERAADWTTLHKVRERFAQELAPAAPRPSLNDFLLQAVARTLTSFPALNAIFSGDVSSPDANILPASGTHIGLVVAVDDGLLVPVFHNADQLSLVDLARRRADTVDRALRGRLKREELEGATFSISNLGARGPDRFTAVINPPQSAILAVGRQRDCVVASEGQIYIKPMSQLTLTVDHRVADGRLASDFLTGLTEILEGEAWRLQ
jgi:pyruvate dehydrogenase E2 component (dihydrolipoamide acetyltransferase)